MAHPLAVAENAMRSFVVQWLSGLAPSLRILTKPNGSIEVISEVSSSLIVSEVQTTAVATCCRRSHIVVINLAYAEEKNVQKELI